MFILDLVSNCQNPALANLFMIAQKFITILQISIGSKNRHLSATKVIFYFHWNRKLSLEIHSHGGYLFFLGKHASNNESASVDAKA